MSVRQYIGARYVTKIYENSLDPSSAEWEQGTFEPFVMVTWQNSTYLSKKQVPGSVGNPADNPNYWVCTGYYNGQILSLQNQIDHINNDVIPALYDAINTASKHDNVIVVSDSYGTSVDSQVPFIVPLQTYLGLDNDHYHAWVEGRLGIYKKSHSNRNAQEVMEYHENDIVDKDTITDIIIALGVNDSDESASDIISAGASLMAYCHTTYPNATVHVGYISCARLLRDGGQQGLYWNSVKAYIEIANSGDGRYMTNIEYIMHDGRNFISDDVHPTTAAGEIIAQNITGCVYGSTANYKTGRVSTPIVSSYGAGYIVSAIDNGITEVDINLTFTTCSLTGIDFTEIGTYDTDSIAVGQGGSPIIVPSYAWTANGVHPILLSLSNGKIYCNGLDIGTAVFSGSVTRHAPYVVPTINI